MTKKDRTSVVYGDLIALEPVQNDKGRGVFWKCKCACGNEVVVSGCNLSSGTTRSCGCKRGNRKHGMSSTQEYNIYKLMLQRCLNPKDKLYPYYGERGIGVCDRWKESFDNFYSDMGPKPSKMHTLDRIDNDGDYGPLNFRWADKKDQARNRRSNRWFEINGLKMLQTDWASYLGVSDETLRKRIAKYGFEVAYIRFNKK